MKKTAFLIVGICLVSFWGSAGEPATAADYRRWVETLSDDALQGRENGKPGLEKAASFIKEEFEKLGLKPLPGQDGFEQRFEVPTNSGQAEVANLIAYLPGSDPSLKNEYVVLSAHYDHIGMAAEGEDRIYNGADDDASGVAVSLGIVRNILALPKDQRPKRSLVVIAWAAEELGLLGSQHFVKNPLFPLEKIFVNLNFELVGHATKTGTKTVWMTGREYSSLGETIQPLIEAEGWSLVADPFPQMHLFMRSDNFSFVAIEMDMANRIAVGVPAHSFTTWGGEPHYHHVDDEADKMDFENMAGLGRVMARVASAMADADEPVVWIDGEKLKFRRFEGKGGAANE